MRDSTFLPIWVLQVRSELEAQVPEMRSSMVPNDQRYKVFKGVDTAGVLTMTLNYYCQSCLQRPQQSALEVVQGGGHCRCVGHG